MSLLPRPSRAASPAPRRTFRTVARLALISLVLAGSQAGGAEEVVRFINTGMREGLANASVSAMVQDAAGFIWIGTQGGLHRWDGRFFTLYENEPFDATSLPHNLIQTMFLDDDGETLWIGTYGGLARLDTRTGRFSSWVHDPGDPDSLCSDVVVSIGRDAAGRLWVGTLEGLDRMEGNSFIHYPVSPALPGSLASGIIRSILRDSRGELWIGTSGGGLYRYLAAADTFEAYRAEYALRSDYVFSIREDAQGYLWLGLWNFGLSRFDPRTGTTVDYPLADSRVYFVNADEPGLVRAGTWGGGLFELEVASGTIRRYRSNADRRWSLPHDTMYSMLVDRSGNAWVGTNGGGFSLLVREGSGYKIYEHDPADSGSRSSGKTTAVLEDSKGRLWIGTYNGGLDRLDPGTSAFRHYRYDPRDSRSLPNDIVVKLYEDSRGEVWAMTNGGVARYIEGSDAFERWVHDPANPESIADNIVYDIIEEPGTGNFWIATYTKGLDYWDRSRGVFIHYPSIQDDPASPSANLVYALAYDAEGRLWVGTNGGLSRYEGGGRFKRYGTSRDDRTALPSGIVRDLLVDSAGQLWIATNGGGVARYEASSDSFSYWTKRDGLQSNIVLALLEGRDGDIWASTTGGLSVLDRASMRWRPFMDQSRLRYGEFTAGRFRARDGCLYFGALNALYRIDPTRPEGPKASVPVRITSIKALNKELETGTAPWFTESIRLGWRENYLSLSFAALEFGDPSRLQYAYMLEGVDDDWVYAGTRSYASYTNLKGGSYVFRVKAGGGLGGWNSDTTELRVRVEPAPWAAWWAIAAYVALGLAVAWIVAVARSRSLLKGRVDELSRLKSQLESANVRLEVLAAHDGLTGLMNRRSLDAELARRSESASRLGEPLAALMIDIDFFKPYNDRYGHQAGDECLVAVAAAIKGALERPQDSAARYGGEEFVALLPGTDAEGARLVAERVRAAVEALSIPHEASLAASAVSVSVGFASIVPGDGHRLTRLVDLADEALYRAKNGGRNRVSD